MIQYLFNHEKLFQLVEILILSSFLLMIFFVEPAQMVKILFVSLAASIKVSFYTHYERPLQSNITQVLSNPKTFFQYFIQVVRHYQRKNEEHLISGWFGQICYIINLGK
jgi:hypothetical protein